MFDIITDGLFDSLKAVSVLLMREFWNPIILPYEGVACLL